MYTTITTPFASGNKELERCKPIPFSFSENCFLVFFVLGGWNGFWAEHVCMCVRTQLRLGMYVWTLGNREKARRKAYFDGTNHAFFQKMLLVQRAQRGYMYVHFFSFLSYAREHFVPLFNIRASSSPRLFIAQLLLQRLPGTNVHVWNKETSAYNWKKRKYCYRVLYLCPQALSYYRPLFNYKVFPFFVHTITPSFAFVIALWPSRIGMWGS